MVSDGGKKYILSDVEDFAKKNSFSDTFKIAKTWEEIGFHVSALSYNGFRVITLSRWGSGVFQLFFIGDTFLKTRHSLGAIHDVGITQWTKDYIDNPYGIQRNLFNIKNGYQEGDKRHYKEFLKNKNKENINENMKKQTIKLNESQLRNIIKESIKKVLKENTGSLDDLILYARNDRKIYDALYLVKSALLKKVKSGVTSDRNQLADSSTLRKIQQFAIKNYSKEITPIFLSAEEKRKLREDFADSILEWIDYDMNNHEE